MARLVAGAFIVAATSIGFTFTTSGPASAAACSGATGVTVVVDRGALGGGTDVRCSADGGGRDAWSIAEGVGFDLESVQQFPGFVCRVNGQPDASSEACVRTPPVNAYWGLFWSDGKSGSWSYSSTGASSLKIPDGGYLGLAWQSGSRTTPGVAAAPRVSEASTQPAPTAAPSTAATSKPAPTKSTKPAKPKSANAQPTKPSKPKPKPATPTTAPTEAPDATALPSSVSTTAPSTVAPSTVAPSASQLPSTAAPTTAPAPPGETLEGPAGDATDAGTDAGTDEVPDSADPTPTASPSDPNAESGGALPAWAVPVVILVLAAAGAGVALWRRQGAKP